MIKEKVLYLLSLAGISNTKDTGDSIMISCPFSRWTHKNGSDRKPSFGIRYGNDISIYNCFSCGESGRLPSLFGKLYERTLDEQYKKYKKKQNVLNLLL